MKNKLFKSMMTQNILLIFLVIIITCFFIISTIIIYISTIFTLLDGKDVAMEDIRSKSISYKNGDAYISFDIKENEWLEILENNKVVKIIGDKKDKKMSYTQSEMSYIANNMDDKYNINHIFYEYILFEGENGELLTALLKTKDEGLIINSGLVSSKIFDKSIYKVIEKRIFYSFSIYVGLIVICIMLVAKKTSKIITNPLIELRENLIKVREGKYNIPLKYKSNNELALIRDDYNYTLMYLAQLEKENELQVESKRQLILDISHDLKTPLTSILGYSRVLLDEKGNDTKKYCKLIYNKAREINSLVEVLTEYTELDSNDLILKLSNEDLNIFIKECFSELYDIIEKNKGTLKMNLSKKSGFISIDKVLFKRVIKNLVINALYHNDKSVEIECETMVFENEVKIKIIDNGRGLKEEDYYKIFEQGVKLESSRSVSNGSGFGLSIAKKIVVKHNGSIQVESKPNIKTIFTIILNRVQ